MQSSLGMLLDNLIVGTRSASQVREMTHEGRLHWPRVWECFFKHNVRIEAAVPPFPHSFVR
jgi:hypothetical protein